MLKGRTRPAAVVLSDIKKNDTHRAPFGKPPIVVNWNFYIILFRM